MSSGPGPTPPGDETTPLPTGQPAGEARVLRRRPSPGPDAETRPAGADPAGARPTGAAPTSPPPTSPPPPSPPEGTDTARASGSEADRVRAEIEATRQELGETVDALSAKLDVKARVEEKKVAAQETVKAKVNEGVEAARTQAHRLQEVATDEQGNPTPPALGAAAGAGILLLLILLLRRRRKRRRAIVS